MPKKIIGASENALLPRSDSLNNTISKQPTILDADIDNAIMSSDIFAPKKDYRKLVIQSSTTTTPAGIAAVEQKPAEPKQVTFDVEVKKKSEDKQLLEYSSREQIDDDGYWTYPPLSELKKKSLSDLRSVENFKVGRKYYGVLEFTEPVDLSSLSLDDICGNIVTFRI